jgi:hypothetical protein
MKILPVGVELFHVDGRTDGQTDVTKRTVLFSNFAKAPKVLSSAPKELIDFVTPIPLKKVTYITPSTTKKNTLVLSIHATCTDHPQTLNTRF